MVGLFQLVVVWIMPKPSTFLRMSLYPAQSQTYLDWRSLHQTCIADAG